MYKISNYSGKIFHNGIEVIPDDRNQEFQDYLEWILENEVEYVDIMPEELEAMKLQQVQTIITSFRNDISALVLPYLADIVLDNEPLPTSIELQRQALKAECLRQINEIIPGSTMSRGKISIQSKLPEQFKN